MIPLKFLALKKEHGDNGENRKRYGLLEDFKLEQGEWPAVAGEACPVGRNHETIFEQRHAPRRQYDCYKGPIPDQSQLLQTQIAIPCQRHEDVGNHQHHDSNNSGFHIINPFTLQK